MQRIKWDNILKFGILALYVSSVGYYMQVSIGSTLLWWLVFLMISIAMFMLWDKTYHPAQLMIWMILVCASSVAGCFFCRDYWDWKLLINNVISYSICLTALGGEVPNVFQKVLHFMYKHIWKLFLVLVFFVSSTGAAKLLIPYSFLALFYPLLSPKYKQVVLCALILIIVLGLASRIAILRFLFCLLAGLFLVRYDFHKLIERCYWIFFILPFALLVFAAKETFNIFEIGNNYTETEESIQELDLTDTRTLLYEEVISTVLERNTVYFGGTPARGYNSQWGTVSQDQSDAMGDMHYGERSMSECSVLNVFLHFGIVGLFVYMLLFWKASYLAIFKANNRYLQVIGFYVAFTFMLGWIGDNTRYDLNMFLIWVVLGMCYSPHYREMTDEEFRDWFAGVIE